MFFSTMIFNLLTLFAAPGFCYSYIDKEKTLFGIEYTFQDSEMVNEPGRSTMTTPHKELKVKKFAEHFARLKQLPRESIKIKTSWKPGLYIEVPGDGNYVVNSEPVTVEFNTSPKKLDEIESAAEPIFKAADLTDLKPYVNPAAERSGMGHIHVGGMSIGDSPFYKHENLLRNIYAFFHKHPSLLYGFSEAYDMGVGSNIETLHELDKQLALKSIFDTYDSFVKNENPDKRANGFLKLIELFRSDRSNINWTHGGGFDGWFAHYRFINLESLKWLNTSSSQNMQGKYTVEFRAFRPPKSPKHAKAMAELLIAIMDHLAKPNYIEPFKIISRNSINLFKTGSVVEADWESVRRILKLKNPLLDEMVQEYVSNIHSKRISDKNSKLTIFESYSEKELKGSQFELRLKAEDFPKMPLYFFNTVRVPFQKIKINGQLYWIGFINLKDSKTNVSKDDFIKSPEKYLKNTLHSRCENLFQAS